MSGLGTKSSERSKDQQGRPSYDCTARLSFAAGSIFRPARELTPVTGSMSSDEEDAAHSPNEVRISFGTWSSRVVAVKVQTVCDRFMGCVNWAEGNDLLPQPH